MTRATVAAVIPTFNVADIVEPTLQSLAFCDEIIVVDMYSTDDTRKICESYKNVRFFERRDYIYGNFNFGMDQASTDWIIRLDSDEVVSAQLKESILEVLADEGCAYGGFKADCHLYFFGQRMKYGFGSSPRETLFRKGAARYKVRSEHEHLTTSGTWGHLAGHYDHWTNPNIARWIDKFNYYSERDIERLEEPAAASQLKVLYRTTRLWQRMFLRPGWLIRDGYLGFVVAGISAATYFMQECKVWEKQQRLKRGREYVPPHPNAS